jgi:hypothetical protein
MDGRDGKEQRGWCAEHKVYTIVSTVAQVDVFRVSKLKYELTNIC